MDEGPARPPVPARSPDMIRSFIAVEIPQPVRRSITRFVRETIGPGYPVRWTREDNLHLTLKFLGDISDGQREVISTALETLAAESRRFQFSLNTVGCFPSPRSARIVWLGADVGRDALTSLQRALDLGLSPLGFKPEPREFSPHLTIGRVKVPLDATALTALPFRSEVFSVDALVLFKSTLLPAAPVYDKLGEFQLAKNKGHTV